MLSDGRMLDRRNLDARGAESNAVNLRSVDNRALKPAVCGDGRLKCPHCCRTYSSKKSYNAHCSRAHGIILRVNISIDFASLLSLLVLHFGRLTDFYAYFIL